LKDGWRQRGADEGDAAFAEVLGKDPEDHSKIIDGN
jgi:hypothetical protein